MKRWTLFLATLAALCLGAHAEFAPAVLCPQGLAYPDGCAGHEAYLTGAAVQHRDMFISYGDGDGQFEFRQRPPFNVAGVDYPVGANATTAIVDPIAVFPPGCENRLHNGDGQQWIACTFTSDTTIRDYNFGLHGCIELRVHVAEGHKLTLINDYFKNGPNCARGYYIILNGGATGSLELDNVTVDGDVESYQNWLYTGGSCAGYAEATCYDMTARSASLVSWISGDPAGSLVVNYSAFLNFGGRAVQYDIAGPVAFNYCYVENDAGATAHGEFALGGTSPPNIAGTTAAVTMTAGSPNVVALPNHGFSPGQPFLFNAPTPDKNIRHDRWLWVSKILSPDAFKFSTTPAGAPYSGLESGPGVIRWSKYNPNWTYHANTFVNRANTINPAVTAHISPAQLSGSDNNAPWVNVLTIDYNTEISARRSNSTFLSFNSNPRNGGTVKIGSDVLRFGSDVQIGNTVDDTVNNLAAVLNARDDTRSKYQWRAEREIHLRPGRLGQ